MEKEENKSKKIFEYDFLKAFAMILVIVAHCIYYIVTSKYGGIDYSQGKVITNYIINFLAYFDITIPMPIFFIVSGALFRNTFLSMEKKNEGMKHLAVKKFKKLMIAFFVVSIFYTIPIKYITGYFSNSQNLFSDIFIGQILIQGNTHLWFLPSLYFIFLIAYFIEKKNIKYEKYIIIPITFLLYIIHTKIPVNLILYITKFLFYFYIGYYFEIYKTEIHKFIEKHKKFPIIGFMIALILLAIYMYVERNNFILKLLGKIELMLVNLLSFLFFYNIATKIKQKEIFSKAVDNISKYTFGIYLYSDPLNYIILFLFFNYGNINYFSTTLGVTILFFIRLVVTFGIAFFITYLLKKLKVKYLC